MLTPDALRIRLLGAFSISVGDSPVPDGVWRLRKGKSVVKMLALAPARRMHRERVAELLWPEHDAAAAANNLHQAIYAARRALEAAGADGARVLALRDEALVLCPDDDPWIDLAAFEAAAARARAEATEAAYQEALEHYAGELLPEDRFEPWAAAPRESARELHVALLLELAELLGAAGQTPAAVEALQRAVVAEPLHETAHRALIRLYATTGRRQQALAQFQQLRDGLRAELGDEPDPETRELYREVLAGRLEPAPRPDGGATNLPLALTSFVGRERELAELDRQLERNRLLTLTGPGGCGKTRLAIEAARARVAAAPDGVWLVELAPLSESELVVQAAATALDVPLPFVAPTPESLAEQVAERRLLVVLDNCEHLIDASAALAEALLRRCPGVRILATSREPLHVPGEHAWRVPSLALPDPAHAGPAADVADLESVRLFCERAAGAAPGFQLTDANAHAVAEICYRLDGMPLAIELAAARVPVLAPEQIAARLGDALEVLGPGSRTALTRQQTLRATIRWSHDLLDERERILVRRLAVFAGGFSLAAAERVCAGPGLEAGEVLTVLGRLVDKSLASADDGTAERRFRLLETIRQYARERLDAAGDDAAATEARHREWLIDMVESVDGELREGRSPAPLVCLEREHDNLRAALASGLRADPPAALRLAAALWPFWMARGYFAEGARWLDAVLAAAPGRTMLRVEALLGACALHLRRGRAGGTRPLVAESLEICRELGDPAATARTLELGGLMCWIKGDYREAARMYEEGDALVDELSDDARRAGLLRVQAILAASQGDCDRARTLLRDCLAVLAGLPDDAAPLPLSTTAYALVEEEPGHVRAYFEETALLYRWARPSIAAGYVVANLAEVERLGRDADAAHAALERALAVFRSTGDDAGVALALNALGTLARATGDHDAGRAALEESLALRRTLTDRRAIPMTMANLGALVAFAGDVAGGRACLAEARRMFEQMEDGPGLAGILMTLGNVELGAGELDIAFELIERSRALFAEQPHARACGWAHVTLADVAAMRDEVVLAREQLAAAEAIFADLGEAPGLAQCRAVAGRLGAEPAASHR